MSKKSLLVLIVILSSVFFPVKSYSQESPDIEFGEFSKDEFNGKYVVSDSNATALFIYNFGDAKFDKYLEVEYTKHVRIKILTRAGYRLGTVKIPYRRVKNREKVTDIEGYTAYLDNNGNIVKKELNSDDIFDEELDKNISVKRFTLPNLQPGCIIEYLYTVKSESMYNFPREWVFQKDEPVLWSEYRTEIPGIYRFAIFEQKTNPLFVNEQEEYSRSYSFKETSDATLLLNGFRKRMVMKNIPALREEPFMKSMDDYSAKVVYQLAAYDPPFSARQKIIPTWEELGKSLMEDENFGECLDGTGNIENKVKELTGNIDDPNERLLIIYNFVKNSIVWNNKYAVYADDLDDVLEKKKGDSGDINLLLAAMLKAAGLEVHPIIISTREHGTIYTEYPILNQFNNVIIDVKTPTNVLFLDATNRLRPYFLLPKPALNNVGLLILDDKVGWITIDPLGKDLNVKLASVSINSDGSIKGFIRIKADDYSALSFRTQLAGLTKPSEYLNDFLKYDKSGIETDSIKISNMDNFDQTFTIDANISSNSFSQVYNDLIYVNPNFMGKMDVNPFKLDKREFPVDYAYPIDHYYKVNIHLPNGYQLKDYPKPVTIKMNNDAGFEREIAINGTLLQFSTHFHIDKVEFSPNEYSELKNFYDKVISAENESLVLTKSN